MTSRALEKATRFAHSQGLALAALGCFVVGCGCPWALGWTFAILIGDHAGGAAAATSPGHLAYANLITTLCAGGVLAAPLIAWLAGSLIAPAAFERARQQIKAYLATTYLFAFIAKLLLHWHVERLKAVYSIDPGFSRPAPLDEVLLFVAGRALLLAAMAALVVPAFVLARFQSARPYGLGLLAPLLAGGGLFLLASELRRISLVPGRLTMIMIAISTGAGLLMRRGWPRLHRRG